MIAGFAVLIVLSARHRIAWVLAITGAAAAGIGWWQVVSVPPETGPSSISWLLPAVAAAAAVVAITLGRSLVSHALVALAGLQLALWAFLRRDGLVKALLPTDAPFWLDRGVTAAAAVVGVRRDRRRRPRHAPPARRRGLRRARPFRLGGLGPLPICGGLRSVSCSLAAQNARAWPMSWWLRRRRRTVTRE